MDTLTKRIRQVLSSPMGYLTNVTPTQLAVIYSSGIAFLLYAAVAGYHDYHAWLKQGPGGLPYNPIGWLVQGVMGLFVTKNTTSVTVYDTVAAKKKFGQEGKASYLSIALRMRKGVRPIVPRFLVPQRQAPGQWNSREIQQRQSAFLTSLATANPTLLHIAPSKFERYGAALYIRPENVITSPPGTGFLGGEIAHFHTKITGIPGWTGDADGSAHCALSVADAREVVGKGWGERHRFSGSWGFTLGYTMVYAPRDEEELEIVERIVRAGVAYMTKGRDFI